LQGSVREQVTCRGPAGLPEVRGKEGRLEAGLHLQIKTRTLKTKGAAPSRRGGCDCSRYVRRRATAGLPESMGVAVGVVARRAKRPLG